jgi:hypothetical protein
MKIGGTEINDIKIGNTTINKVYKNGTLVYEKGPDGNPSLLNLTVVSTTQIDLDWTIGSTNQDGHKIYISTDNVSFTLKGTVTGTTASYSATGLTENNTYYFYVVAYKGSKVSTVLSTGTSKTFTVEYNDLYNQLSQKPINSIAVSQSEFISELKGGNSYSRDTWSKFACLIPYFAGMNLESDALFWWNNPTKKGVLSAVVPTYVAKVGFTGNGSSSYINTTFNPAVDGGSKYTQNDNSNGHWFQNNRTIGTTTGSGIIVGTNGLGVLPLTSAGFTHMRVQGVNFTKANITSNYLFTGVRNSSTLANGYFNRVIFGVDVANNSVALQNLEAHVLDINNNGVEAYYQTDTIGLVFYGASLDQTDINVIIDACTNLSLSLMIESSYSDECAGTTIDTDKWTITNPDPDAVIFSQNDGIIMTELGDINKGFYINHIDNNYSQRFGIWEFDILSLIWYGLAGTLSYTAVGLRADANNQILIYHHKASGYSSFRFKIIIAGVEVYNVDTTIQDIAKFKFIVTPFNEIKLYSYANDTWSQIGVTKHYILGGVLSFFMTGNGYNKTMTVLRDLKIMGI